MQVPNLQSEPAEVDLARVRTGRGLDVPDRPALAPGVELVGELADSAFKESQWLIQRNGRYIQVAEPVYLVAQFANSERTPGEIAREIGGATEWVLTAGNVTQIISEKLIPLKIIEPALSEARKSPAKSPLPSPLAVRLRVKVLGPHVIDPIAAAFQFLFAPAVLCPVLIASALAHGWLYWQHGLAASFRSAIYTPGALVAVLAVYLASGVFHELGHATALRCGGGRARSIGVGIYLIYPAFYTDTTDTYRLGRWARVRTDFGGFYFHLIVALAVVALYFASGQEWLLLIVLLIDLDIARQLTPFVRFDGYWALTDILGIPDVLSYMKRGLARPLSKNRSRSGTPELKRFAKVVFVVYTVITAPVLVVLLALLFVRGPLILSALSSALALAESTGLQALKRGAVGPVVLAAAQMMLTALQIVGLCYALYAVLRGTLQGLWRLSKQSRERRIASAVFSGTAIGLLTSFWLSGLGLTSSGEPVGVQTFPVSQRTHVEGAVVYPQSPPVGGPHSSVWQNCGFYRTPIANENGVHSLEHGAVWITYRPDLPPGEVASLRELATRQSHVLVSAYPGLPHPVVASAWGRQLQLGSSDDPRLDQFVRVYRLSSHAPESGGPCTGGLGRPDG